MLMSYQITRLFVTAQSMHYTSMSSFFSIKKKYVCSRDKMVTGFNDYPGSGSRARILKQKFNQQLPVWDI